MSNRSTKSAIKAHSSPDYNGWFRRSAWSPEEAALLLYGYEPKEWYGLEPMSSSIINGLIYSEFGEENVRTMLDHLVCFLRKAFNLDDIGGKLSPETTCQWAYVTKNNFWYNGSIFKQFKNKHHILEDGYDSYDDNFYDMAKKDLWLGSEIRNVLTYCPEELGTWFDNANGAFWGSEEGLPDNFNIIYPNNPIRKEVSHLLNLSRDADTLTAIKSYESMGFLTRDYLYKPQEIIEWSKSKGFKLPPKLLEYMGIKNDSKSAEEKNCSTLIDNVSPYVDYMIKASEQLNLSKSNQPKKAVIVDWLIKNAPTDLAISQRKAEYMATFMRTPDKEVGGRIKTK